MNTEIKHIYHRVLLLCWNVKVNNNTIKRASLSPIRAHYPAYITEHLWSKWTPGNIITQTLAGTTWTLGHLIRVKTCWDISISLLIFGQLITTQINRKFNLKIKTKWNFVKWRNFCLGSIWTPRWLLWFAYILIYQIKLHNYMIKVRKISNPARVQMDPKCPYEG